MSDQTIDNPEREDVADVSEIPSYKSHKYTRNCSKCKTAYVIFAQRDDEPEYYTNIYLQCNHCDHFIIFMLPVN